MILNNEVSRVFITYEDRLTRFGFEYLKTMCEMHGTEIIVVKNNVDVDVKNSIEQELMDDIKLLMTTFSKKISKTRNKQNKKIGKNLQKIDFEIDDIMKQNRIKQNIT